MPYTSEDGGRLNNFANEPKMYQSEPPTPTQKRNYLILGAAVVTLLSGLMFVAFSVS
ncbi:hypothetical protein AVDCRST_MAG81-5388 [uncultured Synechococcales cyanobacterium]|uniref:Ssl1498 family light-harvesting-like protein n=1 Tax=uncultured Synechococcales cyanobacterium TaxID=1936017 RepID=A0A6J4VWI2_9CYAN|nr:hypothetical protein AVDCRST_MAG81-5388 [uncultured Synechococcales cyanobacterium]